MVLIENAISNFLADKGKGDANETGTYRRDAKRELERFQNFLDTRRPSPTTMSELTTQHLREYARYLSEQGWQPNTTRTYYRLVSAFIGWTVREGLLDEHIATHRRATEPLDDGVEGEQQKQAWTPEDRESLTAHVNERASRAIEAVSEDREHAIKATRDRALVYLLAYSGVRGAEVFRHRDDARRKGLKWRHVSLKDNYVRVFAKKQAWDHRALPSVIEPVLERARQALNPPTEDWPVFPTLHRPSLSRRFDTTLRDRGYTASEIEELRTGERSNESYIELCVTYDVPPPSISTDAARHILRRLCDEAGIEPADGTDYLKPHGARRGAGEAMVRAFGYAAAARALDNSEEIVRQHYSHIEAGELADQLTTAFAAVDEDTEAS